MYSVHVNMMTLFISEPQRAVRHLANTQDKVQNVAPVSEVCQRPLLSFLVQSYKLCTYSMFVLYKNEFIPFLFCLSVDIPVCVWVAIKGIVYYIVTISHYILGIGTSIFTIV